MREKTEHSRIFTKSLRTRISEPEVILWSRLREWRCRGYAFRRQHPNGPYSADFACVQTSLVIELDGDQHGLDSRHARDQDRDAYMTERGWRVIRISNDRIYRELGSVLNMLSDAIPPPSPGGDTSPALSRACSAAAGASQGRKD